MDVIKKALKLSYYQFEQLYLGLLRKNLTKGYIFMLHRVSNKEKGRLPANENMKVSPSWLDHFLDSIKKEYDCIRIEDIPQRLVSGIEKPFVTFTMDDGYKDNFTEALPVFKKHNVPFTIFLATDFLDGNAILWWYTLEDLILSQNKLELSDGSVYKATNLEEKQLSFIQIRSKILKLDQLELESNLNKLFSKYDVDWKKQREDMCLSWDDVEKLKKEDLVTLGAHTAHHYNLKVLPSSDMVCKEIIEGQQRLKEMINLDTEVFAYPFGSDEEAGYREFGVLKELSGLFKMAFRSIGGPVTKEDSELNRLPRIMLNEDFSFRKLRCFHKYII